MTLRDAWPYACAVVAAGVPAVVMFAWRAMPAPRPRLSPGRLFMVFGLTYAALLAAFDIVGPAVPLLVAGFGWGMVGGGRGVRTLYRFVYGSAWLADHDDAPRRDARRWQLPLMFGAVVCFTAAMLLLGR